MILITNQYITQLNQQNVHNVINVLTKDLTFTATSDRNMSNHANLSVLSMNATKNLREAHI
jgi:hypothetical protein